MSTVCAHEDVETNVVMFKLFENEEAREAEEATKFVAEIQIRCANCQEFFGFRAYDMGLLSDRPATSPDRTELRVPLISPTELMIFQGTTVEMGEAFIPILVEPSEDDKEHWYKIETHGKWYAVKACCRSCATVKLHGWTYQNPDNQGVLGDIKTVEIPDWLRSLGISR